ncbi:MAG: 16S rRNA (cytosine(967)-C(5))-methyltransferase RsmB, partial [Actinomycetota bacterium]|nr:16S rRNA (cytosine(967)-C(5))-methyltransferase RsmB [Actinomycetota bacterium]
MSSGRAASGATGRVSPARSLAFATLRATFEDGAFTERAFRAEADRLGLGGRDRAQAQRLAYGSVQRRGTSDVAIERLAGRSTRLLDPPVLAALRLGLYELLFADATPDHAAVDQAVELVKAAGAAHAAGFVNAILRRAVRERAQLTAALLDDDSDPAAAAVADSAPRWLAEMWWRELGPEAARATLAACNQRVEVAMR